jgi:hypothetical protein
VGKHKDNFIVVYTVSRTPWTGDQPVTAPLPTHRISTQASMPWVGFEPTVLVFERMKTAHSLDRAARVTGHENVWRSRGMAPRFPTLRTRDSWVVSWAHRPCYFWGQSPLLAVDSWLHGPQTLSGLFTEEANAFCIPGIHTIDDPYLYFLLSEFVCECISCDRPCGLVVRVLGYRSGGPGSIPGTTRKKM